VAVSKTLDKKSKIESSPFEVKERNTSHEFGAEKPDNKDNTSTSDHTIRTGGAGSVRNRKLINGNPNKSAMKLPSMLLKKDSHMTRTKLRQIGLGESSTKLINMLRDYNCESD
jgi:hypothetical protein